MKVYVVLKKMDYAIHWIKGVFSSESLAEEFIEERRCDLEDEWRIEEWEVDKKGDD